MRSASGLRSFRQPGYSARPPGLMVQHDREWRRCIAERAGQLIAHLGHAEVSHGSPFSRLNRERDPVPNAPSLQSSRQDRSEHVEVEMRPCQFGILTERTLPLSIRAHPPEPPRRCAGEQRVLVPRAQWHGRPKHLSEASLSFGDHSLYRGIRREVREPESEAPFLAELNHEGRGVTILGSTADVHPLSNGDVAKHRIDQPQHRIVLGWLLHPWDCPARPKPRCAHLAPLPLRAQSPRRW